MREIGKFDPKTVQPQYQRSEPPRPPKAAATPPSQGGEFFSSQLTCILLTSSSLRMAYKRRITDINNLAKLKGLRRALRHRLTPAEAKLWTFLQKGQLDGRKFRRQHSVGFHILDFYCPMERLAIELDGQGHYSGRASRTDRSRTVAVERYSIRILRFENEQIFKSTTWVLNRIKANFGWWNGEVTAGSMSDD